MPWPKRPYQTEISSPQWVLRVARKPRHCQSPVTKTAHDHGSGKEYPGQVHEIKPGDQYAYNTYYQASYCLHCFDGWAPSGTVRKLGRVPLIDQIKTE